MPTGSEAIRLRMTRMIIGMVLCAVILAALNVVYMSKMIKEETELLAPILSAVLLPSIVFCLLPDLGELFAGNRR
jgi:hypothetical protein